MGYGQHVRSPRGGDYWLARYLNSAGKYGTVKDDATGRPAHYKGKRDAKKAADAAEAAVREGRAKEAAAQGDALTFGQWTDAWYAALDLAPTTMDNYRRHMELHILPRFEHEPLAGILAPHVEAWKNKLRADGYAESSIGNFHATLRACLQAAVPSRIPSNPAASGNAKSGRRGIARAAGGSAAEKIITTVLGGLLIAERMSILTGRDAEFVMTLVLQHAALRLGEGIGLEACYASPGNIRVEWQLSQVGGKLIKAIPKDGSRGDVTVPYFLSDLIAWHAGHAPPAECPCHGFAYLFTGDPGARKRNEPRAGVTIRDVAEAAGVSPATVWGVTGQGDRFAPAVRAAVLDAVSRLGWMPGAAPISPDWHWARSRYEELIKAAGSGMFQSEGRLQPTRAVPLAGDWPGTRLRNKGSQKRAEWCWMPVAQGLTPHGLRHSARTWMEENGVHHVLAEAQMRHEQQGIDVYRHVTDQMRQEYRGRLEEAWDEAVQRRLEMAPGSPVRVVDALLREHAEGGSGRVLARNSQRRPVTLLRARR
jgi:hypothetical protein